MRPRRELRTPSPADPSCVQIRIDLSIRISGAWGTSRATVCVCGALALRRQAPSFRNPDVRSSGMASMCVRRGVARMSEIGSGQSGGRSQAGMGLMTSTVPRLTGPHSRAWIDNVTVAMSISVRPTARHSAAASALQELQAVVGQPACVCGLSCSKRSEELGSSRAAISELALLDTVGVWRAEDRSERPCMQSCA